MENAQHLCSHDQLFNNSRENNQYYSLNNYSYLIQVFGYQFCDQVRASLRQLGGFEDDSVPGGNGPSQWHEAQLDGIVPRRQDQHHSIRVLVDQHPVKRVH